MKPEFQFKKIVSEAVEQIESKYGLRVVWRDLPAGVTGDLDGAEIVLDTKNDPETELYVLLHLFGHTSQWNNSVQLRSLGHEQPIHATPEKLAAICTYERNASRIGISLLFEVGHGELQEWMSRFFWADWSFLKLLYTDRGTDGHAGQMGLPGRNPPTPGHPRIPASQIRTPPGVRLISPPLAPMVCAAEEEGGRGVEVPEPTIASQPRGFTEKAFDPSSNQKAPARRAEALSK